jgi:7-cyano-7-deazaguanine synthase
MKNCVVLLSGGLDSATVLAIAKAEGFALHALTITYGQRHLVEVQAVRGFGRRGGASLRACRARPDRRLSPH